MTDKPKRPMSAYMLWFMSVRESIKSEHPGIKVTDIAKKAGELWRAMEDKTEWETKAVNAKEQYARDLALYNASSGAGDEARQRKKAAPAKSKKRTEETDDDDSEEGDSEEDEESD